jgi:hypothetical protein
MSESTGGGRAAAEADADTVADATGLGVSVFWGEPQERTMLDVKVRAKRKDLVFLTGPIVHDVGEFTALRVTSRVVSEAV